jgi:hypothetical protein
LAIFLQTIDDYEKCSFGFIPFYFGFFFFSGKRRNCLRRKVLKLVKKLPERQKLNSNFPIINEELPLLIPKTGRQIRICEPKGKFIIQPEYHIAVFFMKTVIF